MTRRFAAVVAVLACAVLWPASALAGDGHGPVRQFGARVAAGIGDPYFPLDGNGGYDVQHYDLDLAYDPATRRAHGRRDDQGDGDAEPVELQPRPQRADRPLDQGRRPPRPLEPRRRRADRHAARGLRKHARFTTVVAYDGVPQPSATQLGGLGFIATDDGAVVAGQPDVAATWYPVNDHPLDKASYTFRITSPRPRGDRQRRAESTSTPPRLDDLDVGREGADGLLPHHGDDRRVRPAAYRRTASATGTRSTPTSSTPVEPRTGDAVRALQAGSRATSGSRARSACRPAARSCRSGSTATPSSTGTSCSSRRTRSAPTSGRRCPTSTATRATTPATRARSGWSLHPFLAHYQTDNGDGSCSRPARPARGGRRPAPATATSSGRSTSPPTPGQDVEVSISYASDDIVQRSGRLRRRRRGLDAARARPRSRTTATRSTAGPSRPARGQPGQRDRLDRGTAADAPPTPGEIAAGSFAREPEIIAFLSGVFGPLPVLGRRRHRRRRPGPRLRARDPDAAGLRAGLLRRTRRTATPSSSTSSRTSGRVTAWRSPPGSTSGSTRASRPTPSGCGASARGSGPRRRSSTTSRTRHPRRRPVLGLTIGDPGRTHLFDIARLLARRDDAARAAARRSATATSSGC